MLENDSSKIPIRFLMAISSNQVALSAFLKMDDKRQGEIISKAQEIKSQRQMQSFVNSLASLS